MNPDYPAVAQRARHRCEYCRAPEAIFNLSFEVEHAMPSSRGGSDDHSNLVLSCRACNLFKGDRTHAVDPHSNAVIRLFHPRQDNWQEHFQLERETGRIAGITEIGRATEVQLRMNSELQLQARQSWIRLGIY